MALLLCLETSTPLCSVALAENEQVLALQEVDNDRNVHAEKLNIFVDDVLLRTGRSLKDVAAVAVGTGPGSYTGLRIGLSAAKGYAYALGIPIMGIPTLTTLCSALRSSGSNTGDMELWPMIDARRMEVYSAPHSMDGVAVRPTAPLLLDAELEKNWATGPRRMVFGNGADKAVHYWERMALVDHVPGIRPTAGAMAALAHARYLEKDFDDVAYLVPEYGKEARVVPGRKAF